jgi:hypothetical protein
MKEKKMPQNTINSDLFTSIRRTVVPMIMGWIAVLPISQFVDTQEIEAALVVLLGSGYYASLRLLESKGVPAASWWIAFGRTPAPVYSEKDGE